MKTGKSIVIAGPGAAVRSGSDGERHRIDR